jgi:hypothetical protein
MSTDASYSEMSKILSGSLSTVMSKPASRSFLAVVGVRAALFSNVFVSQRSHKAVCEVIT